jgi:hypothetical protein
MQVKQAKQFKRKGKEITIENPRQQPVSSLGVPFLVVEEKASGII